MVGASIIRPVSNVRFLLMFRPDADSGKLESIFHRPAVVALTRIKNIFVVLANRRSTFFDQVARTQAGPGFGQPDSLMYFSAW
jgi:hypothetical protein